MTGPGPVPEAERARRTLRLSDVGRMLVSWATGAVALIVAAAILPGLRAASVLDLVAVAAVMAVFGALVRPVLSAVAATLGWFAVTAAAIAGEAVTMLLVLLVVPGVEAASFWTLIAATWIAATVSTVLTWLVHAGTDEAFATALWRYGGRGATVPDAEVDGVVFVQLDGLPFPVAQWAMQGGTMPTLRRWLDQGSHRLLEWTVQMPCTTPGQPARAAARVGRGGAGIPLVRPRARPDPGGQPSGRRGRDRGTRVDRQGTAGRPRCVRVQPVLG